MSNIKKNKKTLFYWLAGLILMGVLNYFNNIGTFSLGYKIAAVIAGGALFFITLMNRDRSKLKYTVMLLLGILLVFNVTESVKIYEWRKYKRMMAVYNDLACEAMPQKFAADEKNNDIKYFSFGLGSSLSFNRKMKEFNINVYHQGCVVKNNLICYDSLVENYLLNKHGFSIVDFANAENK